MRHMSFAIGALSATLMLLATPAAAQDRIGAAAAVRNQVTASGAGQERTLAVGNPVYQDQTISTGANSVAQLLFTDQTTLSIGQRSQVTLDRYVYDPSRASGGGATVSMARGAMRFVSGTQDPRNYQVRTPVATIGVRGTIVDLLIFEGHMFGILDEGRVIFTLADGSAIELDRPGTAVEFFSDGTASNPFTWRGRYETSYSTATFPLFGNPFADYPWFDGAYDADDASNRTDDLNSPSSRGGL